MLHLERELNETNIDRALADYVESADSVGDSIRGLTGIPLLETLKRGKAQTGPYPKVALFEAANRIMTDLVILRGVKWLLSARAFPFRSYTVEYGHEDNNDHDLMAKADGRTLIGEAFNVAPSFFGTKKQSALKKLRASTANADFRVILCNDDAVQATYSPKPREHEFFVFISTANGAGRVVRPPNAVPIAATTRTPSGSGGPSH